MNGLCVLELGAGLAAILTAIVAVGGYGRYALDRHNKRVRLESYLKTEKAKRVDKGQRTVLHLVARLRMTENEVLDAAFRSKHVRSATVPDETGRVASLLLEYTETSSC